MSISAPFNIALLGAGWFGREAHLRNLVRLPGVRVVAASSRGDASLDAARAIVGPGLLAFHDWRDALQVEGLDAVIIALTNDRHHEACLAAFARGLHVLCEKPLALTLAQCDDIIAAGAAAGRVLQIGHEMRFQRLYREMKTLLDQGAVGEPHLMWCREFRGPMRSGWRGTEAMTGGTLLEKNCHHFDLFHWMLGRRPLRVAALGGRNVLLDREILDNAQVLVEYEGGRRATLELCLFAPRGGDCEIGLVGDAGRIDTRNQALSLVHHRFDSDHRQALIVDDDAGHTHFTDSSGRVDRGIGPELEHFVQCCRTGAPPLNDGPGARLAVAVCLAAQASIQRRETVWMEEFSG